jgi:transcriptional regulator
MGENTQVIEYKDVSELNRTEKSAVIVAALQKEGYSDSQISKFLEVSRARVCQVNKKIKQGSLHPLINKARKSVKLILEGKSVGNAEPKASDVLTAAKMVLDRSDPITVKTENTSVHMTVDITQEDRNRYKKALGIIDAEYEVIQPLLLEESPNALTTQEVKCIAQSVKSIQPYLAGEECESVKTVTTS